MHSESDHRHHIQYYTMFYGVYQRLPRAQLLQATLKVAIHELEEGC
jgi:hypothetical protein